jgi:hypothetical protein
MLLQVGEEKYNVMERLETEGSSWRRIVGRGGGCIYCSRNL